MVSYVIRVAAVIILIVATFSCGEQKTNNHDGGVIDTTKLVNSLNNYDIEDDETYDVTPPSIPELDNLLQSHNESFLSGVVLIRTMYYYKLSFGNVLDVYFSGVDDNGEPKNMTIDESLIRPSVSYGTGFLINDDGLIATNSHVANPSVDVNIVRSSLLRALSSISSSYQEDVNDLNVIMAAFVTKIANEEDENTSNVYLHTLSQQKGERDNKQRIVESINLLYGMDYKLTCDKNIGIAFSDSYITKQTDFLECVLKIEDKENDLALIQLKRRGMDVPNGCYIFNVSSNDEFPNLPSSNVGDVELGTNLTMIAYNLGPTLALTEDGIKAQMTSGKCTQVQKKRIMYDISSLPGSSGAPIINEKGQVVAVNYAGISTTQGFNYGIKLSMLKRLIDDM